MKLCFVNLIYNKKKFLLLRGSSYFKIGLYKSKNHRKVKVQISELFRKYPFAVLCTSAFLKLIINHNITYFILTNTKLKVIYKSLGNEKSAYIIGQYIGVNASSIMDINEYCTEMKNDGIILFLDFEKAFDSFE